MLHIDFAKEGNTMAKAERNTAIDFGKIFDLLKPVEADDSFKGSVEELRGEVRSFEAAIAEKENASRDLTIAIVGRVKSGKSSFLNALLFDGENVLPNAATPMTAALTFIQYDKTCHAQVEFFSADEWHMFQRQARQYDEVYDKVRQQLAEEEEVAARKAQREFKQYKKREITEELVGQRAAGLLNENWIAAHELVSMARGNGFDVTPYLGKKEGIKGVSTPQELAGKLQDYVGARGHFTPIVCSTTIFLNDPKLEGYRIVDTPGTNDPVISRGKKTNDSLKKADVVLAMSPAGRFFDKSDLGLLGQNLPNSGINDFMLLASQYDLAVGNVANEVDKSLSPFDRMIRAMQLVQRQLVDSYTQRISEIAKQATAANAADAGKWERLLQEKPQCVSAQAFILAKHWDRLTEHEREQLEVFNTRIPGYEFDTESLGEFSMMDIVHDKVDQVKARKSEILEKGKAELAVAAAQKLGKLVVELRNFVQAKIATLESGDVEALRKSLKEQLRALERGRASLEDVFEQAIIKACQKFEDILAEVREARSAYSDINVQSESHTESYTAYVYRGGTGFLDWLCGPKEVTRYRTCTTRYAEAYQAVDMVDDFATKARRMLEKGIRDAVDIKVLQNRIVDAALAIFEDSPSDDFDVDMLKSQILRAVRMVTIPDADFGDVDYSRAITSQFSGDRVEGGQIEELRRAQRAALYDVIKDLEKRAKAKAMSIEKTLRTAMAAFVDNLIGDIKADCDKTAAALKDKQSNLKRWSGYLPIIDKAKDIVG